MQSTTITIPSVAKSFFENLESAAEECRNNNGEISSATIIKILGTDLITEDSPMYQNIVGKIKAYARQTEKRA